MKQIARLWLPLLLLPLLFSQLSGTSAQEDPLLQQAELLLASMSPAERVGQLFLVTIEGNEISAESPAYTLIRDLHVGGVSLQARYNNIPSTESAPLETGLFASALQALALGLSSLAEGPAANASAQEEVAGSIQDGMTGSAVPLFIALDHPGGSATGQILSGLSVPPSQMALGATWDPEASLLVGTVVGRELSAVGVNLLMGPSLDVLSNPGPSNQNNLGSKVFGGDPYWVAQHGKAYIRGVHEGSQERMAVIATHFPGYGSGDRPLNVEVATIRKSLEQMKQVELAPFMATSTGAQLESSDGFLTAHVRYQGFQGNIRAATAPVSFDPQAMDSLMAIPELASWRARGDTILVSDSLGAAAVKRFYDVTESDFPHRQIARDAFLAGNDLLFLSDFARQGSSYVNELLTAIDTIQWFVERYENEQGFRQRVDQSALRILLLKLRLYGGDFTLGNVIPDEGAIDSLVGRADELLFEAAEDSLTLLAPPLASLPDVFPPLLGEQIVIFTDQRLVRQCTACELVDAVPAGTMRSRILELYGSQSTGQIRGQDIVEFSMADLELYNHAGFGETEEDTGALEATATAQSAAELATAEVTPTPTLEETVHSRLASAEWVIFNLIDPSQSVNGISTFKAFLAGRSDVARQAKVVLFAFGSPAYLDATDVSTLSAYVALYDHRPSTIDAAVRALFMESSFRGRSPISIKATNYDIFQITQPDPSQFIGLSIFGATDIGDSGQLAPLELVAGETLNLETGVIVDLNGNPVPDGTEVRFVQHDRVQGFESVIGRSFTADGRATFDYLLESQTGSFRLGVESGDATLSQPIDITVGDNERIIVIIPTPVPTATPSEAPEPQATETLPPASTQPAQPTVTATTAGDDDHPGFLILVSELQLLLGMLSGSASVALAGYTIARRDRLSFSDTVSSLLWPVIGSLIGYNYLVMGLPGAGPLADLGAWQGLLAAVIGGLLGLGAHQIRRAQGDPDTVA